MTVRIPILGELFRYYSTFRPYAGRKIEVLCLVTLLSGLAEGMGLTLVIPIIDLDRALKSGNRVARALFDGLQALGLDVTLTTLLLVVVALFLAKFIFMYTQIALSSYICTYMEKTLRDDFCGRYARMSYSYYVGSSVGYLNNIVTTEISGMVSALRNYVNVLVSVVFVVVYMTVALFINPTLTAIVVVAFILLWVGLKPMTNLMRTLSLLVTNTNADLQNLIIQKISAFKYLKATAGFRELLQRIAFKTDENRRYKFRSEITFRLFEASMEPMAVILVAVLIYHFVVRQGRPVSDVLVLVLFFHRSLIRAFSLQNNWQTFNAALGSVMVVTREGETLNRHLEQTGGNRVDDFQDAIRLRGVTFSYNDTPVLHGLDMDIKKNRFVGVVGPSGAGKTTLFDLLSGLISPTCGSITFDGRDYCEMDMTSLRRVMGYVTQDSVLFNDTIANNICFWTCDPAQPPCRERIDQAAAQAFCTEFIKATDKGLDSKVGDRGVQLSGGQRQRIAIARELFKKPKLLIFDEATSSLDTESERMVQQSITALKGSCTMVVIAHRLSTIKDCDVVYVLDHGRVVEQGSFDELAAKDGSLFQKMCRAQQL